MPRRVAMLCLVVGLACGACGEDTPRRAAATASPTPTVAAACPQALARNPRGVAQASNAIFRALPRLFPRLDRLGASIESIFTARSLRYDGWTHRDQVLGPALRACGAAVVDRSLVAIIALPRNHLPVGAAIVLLVRTRDGWRPWFRLYPNVDDRDGEVIATR